MTGERAVMEGKMIGMPASPGIVIGPGGAMHGLSPQIQPSPGLPARAGALRHRQRLSEQWHTLPPETQQAITAAWAAEPVPVG